MAEESTTGAIALGLVVAGVGILAIDYALSDPGKSFFDQIKSKLAHKPNVLPSGSPLADGRRALPAGRATAQPPAQAGSSPAPRVPVSRPHVAPLTITPETVKQITARLNVMLGTKLRESGVITPELQQAIKQVQAQLGLPQTGFPDARMLQQLGIRGRRAAPQMPPSSTIASDAAKVVSKTFGGPPSTSATGPDEGVRKTQVMLNSYFKNHALDEDGRLGPYTTEAIQKFQHAEGLDVTGNADSKTHDLLVKKTHDLHQGVFATEAQQAQQSAAAMQAQLQSAFGAVSTISHAVDATGAYVTGVDASDWKTETQDLGQPSQDVIAKIIATETNKNTLKSVSKALGAAGYPKAASAVLASKAGGAAATTGFFPYGFYPLAESPWWADSYGQWW